MARLALDCDRAVMVMDNFLGDGQPEACATRRTRARLLDTVETFKQMG